MYKLPLGPPNRPGWPSPARRICVPLSTPAGILITFRRVRRSRPRPWQVWQGVANGFTRPPQVGQVATCTMEPRIVWRTWRTSPVPLQVVQRTGDVPGSAPEPLQVEHSLIPGDFDFFFNPEDGLLECQVHVVLEVASAARCISSAAVGATKSAKAKQVSQNIRKVGEIDIDIWRCPWSGHTGVAKAIVS